jgi:hypothetical protein
MQTNGFGARAAICAVLACVAGCAQLAGLEDSVLEVEGGGGASQDGSTTEAAAGKGGTAGAGGSGGTNQSDASTGDGAEIDASNDGSDGACSGLMCGSPTQECVNPMTDDHNCGQCGMICTAGKHCLSGTCGTCHQGDTQSCGHAAVGICHPGTQTCQPDGSWGMCSGNQEPKPRDCSSIADNDCDGHPDNIIDAICQCAIGSMRACQTHPGLDGKGICKAGSQSCVGANGNTSSSWGMCNGSVGPSLETCSPTSGDLDCNGIQGDGPGCFTTYYVFFNTPSGTFSCPPKDWLMQTNAQPPVGYTFMTTVKLPTAGIPIYSCENSAHPPEYGSGDGCGLMATKQTLLANGSSATGGNGWVPINYTQVATGGTVALLPEGDPHCCNCQPTTRRDNTPLYTVPTAP